MNLHEFSLGVDETLNKFSLCKHSYTSNLNRAWSYLEIWVCILRALPWDLMRWMCRRSTAAASGWCGMSDPLEEKRGGDWILTNPMFARAAARLKVGRFGPFHVWQRGPSISTLDYLFHWGSKQAVVVIVGPSATIWVQAELVHPQSCQFLERRKKKELSFFIERSESIIEVHKHSKALQA
jgi:hypothetical protein